MVSIEAEPSQALQDSVSSRVEGSLHAFAVANDVHRAVLGDGSVDRPLARDDLAHIDLSGYVRDLCSHLRMSFLGRGESISALAFPEITLTADELLG